MADDIGLLPEAEAGQNGSSVAAGASGPSFLDGFFRKALSVKIRSQSVESNLAKRSSSSASSSSLTNTVIGENTPLALGVRSCSVESHIDFALESCNCTIR